jgi:hypothetical protein
MVMWMSQNGLSTIWYAPTIYERLIHLYSPPPSQPALAGLYSATGSKACLTNPDQLAGKIWPGITRIAKTTPRPEEVVFVGDAKPSIWKGCSEVVSASDSVRNKSC